MTKLSTKIWLKTGITKRTVRMNASLLLDQISIEIRLSTRFFKNIWLLSFGLYSQNLIAILAKLSKSVIGIVFNPKTKTIFSSILGILASPEYGCCYGCSW